MGRQGSTRQVSLRQASGRQSDRGTTLVEVVVAVFLAALAATLLARFAMSSARSIDDPSADNDVTLALDVFANDVRGAELITPGAVRANGRLVSVEFRSATELHRWEIVDETLRRSFDGTTVRAMASAIAATSGFELRDGAGGVISPTDLDAVRWCTRLVVLYLDGDDDGNTWTIEGRAAPRTVVENAGCP